MSRKPTIEEEFDDDTDLPLPQAPLPNTGVRGPLLQEIVSSDDEADDDGEGNSFSQLAGPASPPPSQLKNTVTDITPYKSWTCIYPIYIDAKRPYGTGQRRVERAKSVWWPLSKDIADATNRLGLGTLHEVNKSHPRDWENPGRVRVQWKKDGRLVNPSIKTKKQLLEMICIQIQHLKPENVPKPPYHTSATSSPPDSTAPPASSNKGKAPASANMSKSKSISLSLGLAHASFSQPQQPKSKSKASSTSASGTAPANSKHSHVQAPGSRRPPVPPEPLPPLAARVSPYSPALSSGVLVDAVKAGMSAVENSGPGGGPAGGPGMFGGGMGGGAGQKGKRKVVRVRG